MLKRLALLKFGLVKQLQKVIYCAMVQRLAEHHTRRYLPPLVRYIALGMEVKHSIYLILLIEFLKGKATVERLVHICRRACRILLVVQDYITELLVHILMVQQGLFIKVAHGHNQEKEVLLGMLVCYILAVSTLLFPLPPTKTMHLFNKQLRLLISVSNINNVCKI